MTYLMEQICLRFAVVTPTKTNSQLPCGPSPTPASSLFPTTSKLDVKNRCPQHGKQRPSCLQHNKDADIFKMGNHGNDPCSS